LSQAVFRHRHRRKSKARSTQRPDRHKGPIDTKAASHLQASIRAQLQIKSLGDWDQADVYQALDVVLKSHETKPWFAAIDDPVLDLFRSALRANDDVAVGSVPETPYEARLTVKQNGSEWFVEVQVQILDENGQALGF